MQITLKYDHNDIERLILEDARKLYADRTVSCNTDICIQSIYVDISEKPIPLTSTRA